METRKHGQRLNQVDLILRPPQKESGSTTAQILTKLGISEATLNRWQATYGAMTKSEAKELQRLRDENTRLKRLLGQAELEKAAWNDLSEGNF